MALEPEDDIKDEKNPRPLDEDDIALFMTYGLGPYSTSIRKAEKEIKEMAEKINDLCGLLRCGKSCRLRWLNYLRPGIKSGNISEDEEDLILRLHDLLENRWSLIAGRLPSRTDNEIKNHWNTHLLKKLNNVGIHPHNKPVDKKKKKPNKKTMISAKNEEDKLMAEKQTNKNEEKIINNDTPNIKVYLPKPIKISLVFSRNSNYDSLVSDGMSNSDAAAAAAWPTLFEIFLLKPELLRAIVDSSFEHPSEGKSINITTLEKLNCKTFF